MEESMPSAREQVEARRETIVDFCRQLVQIHTVNPPGENYAQLCDYLVRTIRTCNCDVDVVPVPAERADELYWWGRDHPRMSVVGRYRNSRRERAGLHLSGHYDTVPAGAGWTHDPWAASTVDGRMYGLGASDMKGGIASILGVLQILSDLRASLSGDLTFSFTPDEETGGMAGLGYLAEQRRIRADLAIITETAQPNMVKMGHRGVLWVEITTRGRNAHGSVPYKGINAFDKMVKVAQALKALEGQTISAKRTAYPTMEERQKAPTIMVGGVVEGGLKTNVVPDRVTVTVDRRLIPEETLAEAFAEIQAAIAAVQREDSELQVELKRTLNIEASAVPADHQICRATAKAHAAVYGTEPRIVLSPGFNDAHYLTRDLGIPCITYGPGTSGTAHAPDEYIVIEDLVKTTAVLAEVTLELLH
jgi:succinyl-diaminopimelate desuccinylase